MNKTNKGILLMNLGSPDGTETAQVRKYLNEFLMDKRVIDKSFLFRFLLVKGIITPFRAPKSAEAYKTIWTKEGSPLIEITRQLMYALQQQVEEPVAMAMRYGNPNPKEGFEELLKANKDLEEVVAVPLYPHYAMSSYETAVEYAKEIHKKEGYKFKLTFVPPFYNHVDYISALEESIKPYLVEPFDHLLFSYHGVPGRHLQKTDPTNSHCLSTAGCCEQPSQAHSTCYRHQCLVTTQLLTQALGIPAEKYSISFQSRLGKGWLEPFTDVRLEEMPKEGIKKLLVICPAFISDCLETLEEIEIRGKEIFMEAGGETYKMVPCLNVQQPWVNALKNLCEETVSLTT